MMEFTVFLIISAVCLLGAAVFAVIRGKSKYRRGRILQPSKILFVGVVLSAVALFIPIYINTFRESGCGIFETVLIAVHNMIRLFIVDGEFSIVTDNMGGNPQWLSKCYTTIFSVLFVMAPMLTFGFVLSFFNNISAYKRYITHYGYNTYIFSELNERSLALAESLSEKTDEKRFFVFTDVSLKEGDGNGEFAERARELGAVFFKKDIQAVNFSLHSKKSELNFFAVDIEENGNTEQALGLINLYKYRENTNLYVFSTKSQTELLIAGALTPESSRLDGEERPVKIRVRRINEVRSLVNRSLYDEGYEKIFESAVSDENGIKRINAVVVGMGRHGTEMTKALSWFCQMDGYRVEINCFDIDPAAEDKFSSLCPELMSPRLNGVFNSEGEARYKISVHSGMDVDTKAFDDAVVALPRATYVFVALGDDEKNIEAAVKLRALFLRAGYSPEIQAIVYNTEKNEALSGIKNFKNQEYKVEFIGALKTTYSEKVILGWELEKKALDRHLKWGGEEDFWRYDYNYKSSVASAIHYKMKVSCGIRGIEAAPNQRSEEELWALRILEHRRWNAYMRSEGYVYGGTTEKSGRNDLAKTHNCLVPFEELPLSEQEKDDD